MKSSYDFLPRPTWRDCPLSRPFSCYYIDSLSTWAGNLIVIHRLSGISAGIPQINRVASICDPPREWLYLTLVRFWKRGLLLSGTVEHKPCSSSTLLRKLRKIQETVWCKMGNYWRRSEWPRIIVWRYYVGSSNWSEKSGNSLKYEMVLLQSWPLIFLQETIEEDEIQDFHSRYSGKSCRSWGMMLAKEHLIPHAILIKRLVSDESLLQFLREV